MRGIVDGAVGQAEVGQSEQALERHLGVRV